MVRRGKAWGRYGQEARSGKSGRASVLIGGPSYEAETTGQSERTGIDLLELTNARLLFLDGIPAKKLARHCQRKRGSWDIELASMGRRTQDSVRPLLACGAELHLKPAKLISGLTVLSPEGMWLYSSEKSASIAHTKDHPKAVFVLVDPRGEL